MDDLISRQTAQRLFAKALTYQERIGRYKWTTAEAKQWIADFIEDLPSAQPEIIHCADCKWFQCNMRPDGYLPKGVEEYECRHWCGWCNPVDFCSYAERRTDE